MLERIKLEEAIDLICSEADRCSETEIVKVEDAGGRILAEDIYAEIDNPPFPRSPIDGYAVKASDLNGASPESPITLKVVGCIYAGENGQAMHLNSGEAIRIMTGAPFPKGSDTAVKQEDTDYGEVVVQVYKEQNSFDNYCYQGEDFKKGMVLLQKDIRLTFAELGILSSVGKTTVQVYRQPVIRLITTGDEVCQPGSSLMPGKIYDSNGMMIFSRLRELGVELAGRKHAADTEESMAQELKEACKDADVVITTGGVSVGKKDILHGALEILGARKVFWRVKIQPGTPTIFSVYKNTLIISLSGNPFGAVANLELLIRPLLHKMTGDERFVMDKREGVLAEAFPKKSKGRRFVRAIYHRGQVTFPSGIYSSGAISALRGCNCLMDVEAGSPAMEAGERVTVWML